MPAYWMKLGDVPPSTAWTTLDELAARLERRRPGAAPRRPRRLPVRRHRPASRARRPARVPPRPDRGVSRRRRRSAACGASSAGARASTATPRWPTTRPRRCAGPGSSGPNGLRCAPGAAHAGLDRSACWLGGGARDAPGTTHPIRRRTRPSPEPVAGRRRDRPGVRPGPLPSAGRRVPGEQGADGRRSCRPPPPPLSSRYRRTRAKRSATPPG